jgi:hypothetical protein
MVTKDEYDASVKIAQECVEWVEKRIKESEENKNEPHK